MNDQTTPFDADAFMSATIDAPMATEVTIIPVGTYRAMIFDFDSTAFESIDFTYQKGPKAGQPGTMTKFNCPFIIQDDALAQKLNRNTLIVEKQMIVDRDASGGLDFGENKNVALGQIRRAVGQNNPGPWSPANLRGAGPLMVKVVHETFKRKDGTSGKAARISEVAAIK